tara:strand:+ start:52573 stop:53253 length:681 start_codon:yes stop_codon:yes gene_type:complete
VRIFAFNIPSNHSSLDVLAQFGNVQKVEAWPPEVESLNPEASIVFTRLDNAADLEELCNICEAKKIWCFVWANKETLKEIAKDPSPVLADFVSEDFDSDELRIRFSRLVSLGRYTTGGTMMGVPSEIAEDLTKKQLVILKALFEAGDRGLKKSEISAQIWKSPGAKDSRASGFNVHILHLRRRIENFGLIIDYSSEDRVYKLRAAIKPRTTPKRSKIRSTVTMLSQ